MNIFQSYIKEVTYNEYDTPWRDFTLFFPELIESDTNLNSLFETHPFIEAKWCEINDEIKYTIEDELILLPYIRKDLTDENSLLQEIISIADNVLKANLLRSLSDDNIETSSLPQPYFFLEDGQSNRFQNEFEITIENEDKDLLKELKQFEKVLRSFKLNQAGLIADLYKSGFKTQTHRKLIHRVPIVKQLDYFDSTVYELLIKNPELLKTLDWRIFEEMLADILKTFGYTIELTRKTKDGGIDVIAIKADNDFGQNKYILQAKRYAHSVQVSPVRELLYLHGEQRATKSCLATTSTFTKGAWELADKHRWTLELKDREGILTWIDRVIKIKKR
ncbi:MAG: restriction endonuclease [Cytophagales bacterium]|nr:restriction endonuclease [Cytophagales bacterium]